MSSKPGSSTSGSRAAISATVPSPATTSSITRTERSWPIASGDIDCGNTTVSLSGRIGSTAGSVACAVGTPSTASKSSLIPAPAPAKPVLPLPGSLRRAYGSSPADLDRHLAVCDALGHRELHRQDAVLEARCRALRIDVLGE